VRLAEGRSFSPFSQAFWPLNQTFWPFSQTFWSFSQSFWPPNQAFWRLRPVPGHIESLFTRSSLTVPGLTEVQAMHRRRYVCKREREWP